MADFYINIILDDEKLKKIEDAGLSGEVKEIDGKKAIQVEVSKKEKKKLLKGFPDLTFDDSNACVLPEEGENTLLNIILDIQMLDVMKVAIIKLYNPLAGRDISGRGTGGR
ncbi:MAG: hypothetical protein H8E80_10230 [Desulfobacteraceae bacterium]|uniref:Uncharacterized protein n=1 Tax=Candidatus Desulfaltia bathyphila TaxID=2841697 RepID=A0A8J6N9C0_9BACT|nr:hypothetical protein [Candidatus Desulfaltia bathyphila]MBL7196047.1 hypothetical protein [Desulfobacterales bacterium]